jgi:D-alanyl-D-alanine carboxypeptidase
LSTLPFDGARVRRALVALLLAAFALSVSIPSTTALEASSVSAVSGSVSADTIRQLTETLDRAQRSSGVPGLAFAVIGHDRRGWTGVSGRTSKNGGPLTIHTPLGIGSVTKTFTTAIILQLAEQGLVRLSDPVAKYVPNTTRIAPEATIAQLLRHSSGVRDLYRGLKPRLMSSPHEPLTSRTVLAAAGDPSTRAGSGWSYSNTGYYMLGLVAQAVTGKPCDVLVTELATRHDLGGTALPPIDQPSAAGLPAGWGSAFWTSGSMSSTAKDLARWGRLLYGSEQVLQDPMRTAMVSFSPSGYGYGTQRFTYDGRRAVGHSGLLYTSTSLMLFFPQERMSISIIATSTNVNLNAVLTTRYGGKPSLLQLAHRFSRK